MSTQVHIPNRAERLLGELWGKETSGLDPQQRAKAEATIELYLRDATEQGADAARFTDSTLIAIRTVVCLLALVLALFAGLSWYHIRMLPTPLPGAVSFFHPGAPDLASQFESIEPKTDPQTRDMVAAVGGLMAPGDSVDTFVQYSDRVLLEIARPDGSREVVLLSWNFIMHRWELTSKECQVPIAAPPAACVGK